MEYIKRYIDDNLQAWKLDTDRKPLLVRGARQVGKSCAVRQFGRSFKYFLEVNFERDRDVAEFFKGNIDVHIITEKLSMYYGIPVEAGNTLLFFDEIQSCPEAIHSLWFFREDYPQLHVVAAGSLLEFALNNMRSYGVGRISSLFVYPLSFDEYLGAVGCGSLVRMKKEGKPLPDAFHKKLTEHFRRFMMVGGMPAAVAKYAASGSFLSTSRVIADLKEAYFDDFAKYAGKSDPMLLRYTLMSVARQVGAKFVYSQVEGGFRTEQIKNALTLLRDAGLIIPVYHTAANGLPLGAEVNTKFVKYCLIDNGLMLNLLGMTDNSGMIEREILVDSAEHLVDKGGIAEMIAGLEILKSMNPYERHDLYYWQDLTKGNIAEVDYIIAKDGQVVPLEVKSGVKGSMQSLYALLAKPHKHFPYAVRCSLENFGEFTAASGHQIRINPIYAISTMIGA